MQALDARRHRLRRPVGAVVERSQRIVVRGGILAQVQRGQVEAEGARTPEHALQREATGLVAAMAGQAGIDQLEVVDEGAGIRIGTRAARHRGGQAATHLPEQLPVRHVGQPRACTHHAVGQQRLVRLGALDDRGIETDALLALGEDVTERAQIGLVTGERLRALRGECVAHGSRADVRVAVHIAADPGAEAQQRRQFDALAVDRLDRIRERFVEHRQHAVQHAGEIEADVLDLVGDGRLVRRHFGGLPRGGQRLADAGVVGATFRRRAGAVDVRDQALDDRAFLQQQRAPHRFGRMRGEHGFHAHPRQQCLQLRQADAVGAQFQQDRLQAARLRRAALALVVAATADAMHALGHVGRAEVRRERTHQGLGIAQRDFGQALRQRIHRLALLAPGDRDAPQCLDLLQEVRRDLLGQHVADHRTQPAHVVAQQGVGLGEVEGFAQRAGNRRHRRRLARFMTRRSIGFRRDQSLSRDSPGQDRTSVGELAEHRIHRAVPFTMEQRELAFGRGFAGVGDVQQRLDEA